jgi:acyl-CoA oxidase
MPKLLNFEYIGAYTQTEMGHGSDVQNLETIAELDMKTDEIVLHSPTLTSTKWWVGYD